MLFDEISFVGGRGKCHLTTSYEADYDNWIEMQFLFQCVPTAERLETFKPKSQGINILRDLRVGLPIVLANRSPDKTRSFYRIFAL